MRRVPGRYDPLTPFSPTQRAGIVIVLLLIALQGLSYLTLVPMGKGADEDEHLDYALHLVAEHRLPDPRGEPVGQAQHPPLPYLADAFLISLAKDRFPEKPAARARVFLGRQTLFQPGPRSRANASETPTSRQHLREELPQAIFYALRGLDLALMLVAALFLLLALRSLLPDAPGVSVALWAALVSLPAFAFHGAMVSNDPWMACLGAWVCWLLFAARRRGDMLSIRRLLPVSTLLGLAFLVKLHAVGLFAFSVILVIAEARRRKVGRGTILQAVGLLFLGPLLLAAWWHLRQWWLQGGLLALEHHARFRPELIRLGDRPWILYWDAAVSALTSLMGDLGQDLLHPPRPFSYIPGGLILLSLLALLVPASRKHRTDEATSTALPTGASAAGLVLLLAAILLANRHYYHLHGRYFLGMLAPLAVVILAGLRRLLRSDRLKVVLGLVAGWNAIFGIATVLLIVLPRYTIPAAKWTRGQVVAYWDAGHEGFDDESAGGDVLVRRFRDLYRPQDTVRMAFQTTSKPEVVYRFQVPGVHRAWQVRVRYPDPLPRKGGDMPAPTGQAMVVNKWPIHGPISLWSSLGDLVYPLPQAALNTGVVEVWWQNHVPFPSGVGVAEIWFEAAWVDCLKPPRRADRDGAVEVLLTNRDNLEPHGARVLLVQGEAIVADSGPVDGIEPGGVRPLRIVPTQKAPGKLRAYIVASDAGPLADTKLAYWARNNDLTAGNLRVPDLEVLRIGNQTAPGEVVAEVLLRRTLAGRYPLTIIQGTDRNVFGEETLRIEVEGARLEGGWSVTPSPWGEGLFAATTHLVRTPAGEGLVTVRIVVGKTPPTPWVDLDRLILGRDPLGWRLAPSYEVD